METKIKWNEGDGYITATYEGSGSGSASISSDVNEGIDREQSIKVETTDKSVSVSISVQQEGLREVFLPSDGDFVLADGGTFNVLKVEDTDVETTFKICTSWGDLIEEIKVAIGMTWDEFINSSYNPTSGVINSFYSSYGIVKCYNGGVGETEPIYYDTSLKEYVHSSDLIVEGGIYYI